ncbi:MAG: hypothetical protein GY814_19405 [Gammaproteobacteria bacterium]|nr:hypothetical protein [Gammaproteobacteria bacterium]
MKINYISDLHLEMGFPNNFAFGGDILIQASDIVNGKLKGLEILDDIYSRYNHVIMAGHSGRCCWNKNIK